MDHSDAVKQMAAERYLLDELTPELRDAFEEHVFDCPECTLDLRAGAAFIDEAKLQLPAMTADAPAQASPASRKPEAKKWDWSFLWRPAFAAPAFALLLLVIGYQNLATIPAMRSAALEPRVLPWVPLHAEVRSTDRPVVSASRHQGVVLLVDLTQLGTYSSYSFELSDPQGKRVWTGAASVSGDTTTVSLLVPAAGLPQGVYSLALSGITAQGQSVPLNRRTFDLRFID